MQQISQLLALAAALSTASAGAIQGFNYGAMTTDDAARMQADFETSFKTAKNLVGTDNAFTSARLYTMIQAYSTSDVIQAIPAAIATNTSLLLGLWCSGTGFANEMTALKAAIQQYGDSGLSDLVIGISVGSEDLYRNSATSMAQGGGIGQDPATLVDYISQVREAIKGTALSGASIGHVDTWDAWTNGTNSAVIEAIDWLGVDEYPYWQLTDGNSVENSAALFNKAYETTVNVANGKEVWVTETGWAVNGKTEGEAVAGTDTSKTYWDSVGCDILFGNVNTWWYTLSETGANPDFGVSESDSNTTPLYDLSCKNVTKATSSSSASSSTATGTSNSGSGSSGSSGSGSAASGTASSGFAIATSGASGNSSSGSNVTVSTASPTAGTSGSTATSSIVPASGAFANTVSLSGLFAAVALVAFAL